MQGLLGIFLLIVLANFVGALAENLDHEVESEVCDDCDAEELNDFESFDNQDDRRLEERANPPKKPYCERSRRPGWGGKCFSNPMEVVGYTCDRIWNNTYNQRDDEDLCYDNDQACCVDCSNEVHQKTCWKKRNFSISRGYCCDNELQVCEPLESGCVCCKHCKRKRLCRYPGVGYRGFCVTDHDPKFSTQNCTDNGGKIKKRACMGIGCWCCIVPASEDATKWWGK